MAQQNGLNNIDEKPKISERKLNLYKYIIEFVLGINQLDAQNFVLQ
jgi:hypothetical protein